MIFDFFSEIRNELSVVEEELIKAVRSSDPLLTETATHLIKAGGKRLRPAFCLLGGKFANFELNRIVPLAVALELIHMATLVHDDVVDASLTRRGQPTVKAQLGNRISTHIGDYLLGKSLILISLYDDPLIPRVLAETSVKMSEGEILQIATTYDLDQNIKDYFYRINRKTALLISASCQLGAVACGAPRQLHQTLRRFGHYIGMAFQITDDILDMTAEQTKLGKPVGGDLRQGIITLPAIYALRKGSVRNRLQEIISKTDKSDQEIHEAIDLIIGCGGIDYADAISDKYIAKAKKELAGLPDVPVKKTMQIIAEFIGIRSF
ncbi:Heptaprenyl diphosphate synthase component 2 [Sporotomaculum syntrophicum]|uniref:Heptaprenyl diphosphate synthase component 2 n=1 Tax=Sporotomaculum syntrophicum TaxID=182264 RepID=A0A9D2WNL2_9FIRM|nr:Heptaprenyl diphosphate synthase component 2 [Sporotomaculum syntrophicum]